MADPLARTNGHALTSGIPFVVRHPDGPAVITGPQLDPPVFGTQRAARPTEPAYEHGGTSVISCTPEEKAVIGGLLTGYQEGASEVARILEPEHFVLPLYGRVYAAMMARHRAGAEIDYLTVTGDFAGQREEHEVMLLCTDAVDSCPSPLHVAAYARRVYEAAMRRRMIGTAREIASRAYDPAVGFGDVLTDALGAIRQFDDHAARIESGDMADAAEAVRYHQQVQWRLGDEVVGLDAWLGGGVTSGRMYVVAGREGIGKSWLMSTIGLACVAAGARVAVFSMEMTKGELFIRTAANLWGSEAFRLFRPVDSWTEQDHSIWRLTLEATRGQLFIYDKQDRLDHMEAIIRTQGIDVAFIDYIQCLRWPTGCRSEFEALSILGNEAFEMASRSRCALLALSQKNQDSIRAGNEDGALGLKNAQVWGARAHGVIQILPTKEAGVIVVEMAKNRFGFNKHNGGRGEYFMDGARGKLVRVDTGGKARPAATTFTEASQPPEPPESAGEIPF